MSNGILLVTNQKVRPPTVGLVVLSDAQYASSIRSKVQGSSLNMDSLGLSPLATQDLLISFVELGSYGLPWSPYTPAGPGPNR